MKNITKHVFGSAVIVGLVAAASSWLLHHNSEAAFRSGSFAFGVAVVILFVAKAVPRGQKA